MTWLHPAVRTIADVNFQYNLTQLSILLASIGIGDLWNSFPGDCVLVRGQETNVFTSIIQIGTTLIKLRLPGHKCIGFNSLLPGVKVESRDSFKLQSNYILNQN